MVLAVAPQRPLRVSSPTIPSLGNGKRQGPIAQFLQHIPCIPMAQGFIVTARSKTVSILSLWARRIISWVAKSMEASTGSASFGALATLFATTLIMLFIANLPLRYFVGTICATLPLAFLLIYAQPYRWQRILTYLDPWQDPQGTGFQIIQSLIAIGSGGLWGTGIAQSQQKFFYLPMQHTDFIFAIMAEEIGFIGSLFFITLCILFLIFGCRISFNMPDAFTTYLVQGIIVIISLQFIINLFVSTGLAPTKGIGLPFISYGNTALVCNLFMIGLVQNAVQEQIP